MKRMKKKVVAMVTLAMFMMTLLPMAAFAGTKDALTASDTEVAVKEELTVTVETDGAKADPIELWAEKADTEGTPVKVATFKGNNGSVWGQKDGIVVGKFTDGQTFNVSFASAGEYVIKAGRYVTLPGGDKEFNQFEATDVITVTGEPVKTVDAADNNGTTDGDETVVLADKNGIQKTKVEVVVTPENNSNTANLNGTVVSIVNNYESRGLKVVNANREDIDNVALNAQGKADFYVTAQQYTPEGLYNIELECNGVKGVAVVYVEGEDVQQDTTAATIKAVPVEKVITKDQLNKVAFEIRNAAGDLIAPTGEPALGDAGSTFEKADYLKVTAPKGVNINVSNLDFVQNQDTKVMELTYNSKDAFKPGDYAIEFILKNGKSATAEFTVDEFGEVVDIEIVADDEVALDKDGKGSVSFIVNAIDENGITKVLDSYISAFEPATNNTTVSIDRNNATSNIAEDRLLSVEPNTAVGAEKDDILGTKVTLLVVADNKTATKEFTLVDTIASGLADYELVFDKTEGTVLKNNVVTPSVVKKDNAKDTKNIKNLYAELISQSNKDANVDVQVINNKTIQIYSDKDTTVDVKVIARIDEQAAYAKTLTFAVGEKAAEQAGDTTVVMTLGSTEMIINNKVVDMKDAAPFAQDNRTFVPFRALGEEVLGATVDYNKDDKTVTYELDGNKIVMTLDSKTYTVNGAEKTMDVAPFAKDNRTYVPVRFVGEALGFNVTGLTNGAGQYVGVAFTK